MRIAIVGYGKMGRTVAELARADGEEVVAELDVGDLSREGVAGTDVAIEFTEPLAAADNLIQLASFGVPVVSGTTGWYDRLPEVRHAVDDAGSALVYAPNFSVGVQLLLQIASEAARVLASRPEFEPYILETHHREKKDAPSGTAVHLRDRVRAADPSREYPVTSVRAGHVPGTHELRIEGPGESLTIAHAARDRTIFARGALVAARWLAAGRRRGVFTFRDVLFGTDG